MSQKAKATAERKRLQRVCGQCLLVCVQSVVLPNDTKKLAELNCRKVQTTIKHLQNFMNSLS